MLMRPLSLLAALALVAAGCGGGEVPSRPVGTNPVASTPAATSPPPDATQPGTGPVTAPAPAAPRDPGAGDEEPIRVRAAFAVRDGRLAPETVTVPPFLAVEVALTAKDGRAHTLLVRAPRPVLLSAGAGETVVARLPGLRPGRYTLALDNRRAGTLVAGGEAGP